MSELPKLDSVQKRLRDEIEQTQRDIRRLSERLGLLASICDRLGHVIIPQNPEYFEKIKTDKYASTSAICAICGINFGWYCPKSPDHKCHYTKTEDSCDYCHMPMERK